MGYKLNVRGASDWVNLLQDLYIEIDNTNWDATTLSGFLDEVQTALDGKKSRNVVKTLLDMTAEAYDVILVDTTSTVTVTLPASASQGDEIYVTDVTANANVQNITIDRNGHLINGVAEDLIMDVAFSSVKLIYDVPSNGWHIDAGGSYFGNDISEINDPFVTLNADFTTGTPTENGGIIMKRGDSDDVVIRWNETTDVWELTTDGTTFETILTEGNQGLIDHGSLSGLADDDHTQYVHTTTARTISATHTFNPATVGAPFTIGANANKQLVTGLNAQYTNGILFSTITQSPSAGETAGDIWFEEVSSIDRSTAPLAAANPNFIWTQGDYVFASPYTINESATTDWYATQVLVGAGGGQTYFHNSSFNFDVFVYTDAGTTQVQTATNVSTFGVSGAYINQTVWIALRPTVTTNPLIVDMESQYQ